MTNHKTPMCRLPSILFGLALSACVSPPPPPPPPSAHFDELSGVLTVDCVKSVGNPGPLLPPVFRFSALRRIEAVEGFGERVVYSLQDGPVALAAPGAHCANLAYYGTRPAPEGKQSVYLVLRDVLSSSGEHYELDLFNVDSLQTQQFVETEKHIYGDILQDVTVTAGATVSIPLTAPNDINPVLYLKNLTGRHSPEIRLSSGDPLTLDITGVGPGTFSLTATFNTQLGLSHEETMSITVCSDDSDLDDCNSDVRDCDCLATDQRLMAELAIREALFRDQLGSTPRPGAAVSRSPVYCLQIEPERRFSDEAGQPSAQFFLSPSSRSELYIDPPDELINRFADMSKVRSASACSRRDAGGVFELTSGEPAVILVSGAISWQGDARVIMEGGYYAHGLNAAGNLFTLELIEGQWRVVAIRPVWQS